MIEIYQTNNTNFGMNGDMTLMPEACVIDAALNGTWEMRLEHPIDEDYEYWSEYFQDNTGFLPDH